MSSNLSITVAAENETMTYEQAIAERIEHYRNKQVRSANSTAQMTYQEVINDLSALLHLGAEKWNPPRLNSGLDDVTMQPQTSLRTDEMNVTVLSNAGTITTLRKQAQRVEIEYADYVFTVSEHGRFTLRRDNEPAIGGTFADLYDHAANSLPDETLQSYADRVQYERGFTPTTLAEKTGLSKREIRDLKQHGEL